MVDLFSGDFTYNIPLFELPGPDGGYPFNLSYHSGIGMDQEASWVGLGWSLNAGAINRSMRGLPDEFMGDEINTEQDIKASHTAGINGGVNLEIFGGDASLGLGVNLYWNNYRGFGYGASATVSPGKDAGAQLGGGLDFDSQNGVGASLSLGNKNASATLGFNSESGLRYDWAFAHNRLLKGTKQTSVSWLGSPVHAYTPKINLEYSTVPLSVSFKLGATGGVFASYKVGGFYTLQKLRETNYARKGYGYYHLENSNRDEKGLMDFNRENDGMVNETMPNLPVPVLTADHYNISGQGTGGMFRAWRSDIGCVYDPYAESITNGGSIGVDLSGSATHFGLSATYTHGKAESGQWTEDNDLYTAYKYKYNRDWNYEPAYFKVYGEPTANRSLSPGSGLQSFRPELQEVNHSIAGSVGNYRTTGGFETYDGQANKVTNIPDREENLPYPELSRKPRAKNIEPITNDWLVQSGNALLPEYDIQYYTNATQDYLANTTTLNRASAKGHHFGGMTVLQENGSRYVYGIPAMNNVQVDATFSSAEDATDCTPRATFGVSGGKVNYKIGGTDEYYQRTETPEYAHSYLLTSILGADYVDINNNGPDEADLGYWVKFSYVKVHDNYRWRTPYYDAHFHKGLVSKASDNRGSYSYGEKEIWYLAKAETKSHVAVFDLDETNRADGVGAVSELAQGNTLGSQRLKRLDQIRVYTRSEYQRAEDQGGFTTADAIPLQTIEFNYDYSLCQGIDNGSTGKLTLKGVSFWYQNNTRGQLTPYQFSYSNSNPNYSLTNNDRWGNYAEGTDQCQNKDFPYVRQFDASVEQDHASKAAYQDIKDRNAQAWHLTNIVTPTGSEIDIEYESDDYAYVQHKKATQMFFIEDTELSNGKVYNGAENDGQYNAQDARVYFKLEHPIPVSMGASTAKQQVYDDYIKDVEDNLYFKIYSQLKSGLWDYVSGYTSVVNYGIKTSATQSLDIDGDGSTESCYTEAYIQVAPYEDDDDYHPFAAFAWQKMRADHPELLTSTPAPSNTPGTSNFDKAMRVKSLLNLIGQIEKLFKGYLDYCQDKDFAQHMNPSKSVIRLMSPDGKKYGGGVRVKKITTSDDFVVNGSKSSYGQIYDYTKEENGKVISSGVASYEPKAGGEENPLTYAKAYKDEMRFKKDNQLFAEMPINESYFPAPSVGYSQVTVRSLATEGVLEGDPAINAAAGVTGQEVHEFYTARDFPTITEETFINDEAYHMYIPVPFLGSTSIDKFTATQGYYAEVNDMHGKPKSSAYYGIEQGNIISAPVSSVEYRYKSEPTSYQGIQVNRLVNGAEITNLELSYLDEVATHHEIFMENNHSRSYSLTCGLDFNAEILFPLFLLIPWPNVTYNETQLKTATTNRIVHRSGIVDEVIATDGLSTTRTSNLILNYITGAPIVTETIDNYDDPVYNIKRYHADDIIASLLFTNHGGSSGTTFDPEDATFAENWVQRAAFHEYGETGLMSLTSFIPTAPPGFTDTYKSTVNPNLAHLYENNKGFSPGTELLLSRNGVKHRATVVPVGYRSSGSSSGFLSAIYCEQELTAPADYSYFVTRSGQRNMLSVVTDEVVALTREDSSSENVMYDDGINRRLRFFEDAISMSSVEHRAKWVEDGGDFTTINPYADGELGILRVKENYAYTADRSEESLLKESGLLIGESGAKRAYIKRHHDAVYDSNIDPYWTLTQEITQYDENGHAVEDINALGTYSAAAYGYSGSLIDWKAANARRNEVFFQSFEDDGNKVQDLSQNDIDPVATQAHTGKQSLEVTSSTTFELNIDAPSSTQEFWVSLWVKAPGEETFDYSQSVDDQTRGVRLSYLHTNGSQLGSSTLLKPTGEIIEGWQKVEGAIEVNPTPLGSNFDRIALTVKSGQISGTFQTLFVDDIRVMPKASSMMSYVYDPANYRLSATLDENNYASFYFYDEEGNLFLTKQETERGVFTINETRAYK